MRDIPPFVGANFFRRDRIFLHRPDDLWLLIFDKSDQLVGRVRRLSRRHGSVGRSSYGLMSATRECRAGNGVAVPVPPGDPPRCPLGAPQSAAPGRRRRSPPRRPAPGCAESHRCAGLGDGGDHAQGRQPVLDLRLHRTCTSRQAIDRHQHVALRSRVPRHRRARRPTRTTGAHCCQRER